MTDALTLYLILSVLAFAFLWAGAFAGGER